MERREARCEICERNEARYTCPSCRKRLLLCGDCLAFAHGGGSKKGHRPETLPSSGTLAIVESGGGRGLARSVVIDHVERREILLQSDPAETNAAQREQKLQELLALKEQLHAQTQEAMHKVLEQQQQIQTQYVEHKAAVRLQFADVLQRVKAKKTELISAIDSDEQTHARRHDLLAATIHGISHKLGCTAGTEENTARDAATIHELELELKQAQSELEELCNFTTRASAPKLQLAGLLETIAKVDWEPSDGLELVPTTDQEASVWCLPLPEELNPREITIWECREQGRRLVEPQVFSDQLRVPLPKQATSDTWKLRVCILHPWEYHDFLVSVGPPPLESAGPASSVGTTGRSIPLASPSTELPEPSALSSPAQAIPASVAEPTLTSPIQPLMQDPCLIQYQHRPRPRPTQTSVGTPITSPTPQQMQTLALTQTPTQIPTPTSIPRQIPMPQARPRPRPNPNPDFQLPPRMPSGLQTQTPAPTLPLSPTSLFQYSPSTYQEAPRSRPAMRPLPTPPPSQRAISTYSLTQPQLQLQSQSQPQYLSQSQVSPQSSSPPVCASSSKSHSQSETQPQSEPRSQASAPAPAPLSALAPTEPLSAVPGSLRPRTEQALPLPLPLPLPGRGTGGVASSGGTEREKGHFNACLRDPCSGQIYVLAKFTLTRYNSFEAFRTNEGGSTISVSRPLGSLFFGVIGRTLYYQVRGTRTIAKLSLMSTNGRGSSVDVPLACILSEDQITPLDIAVLQDDQQQELYLLYQESQRPGLIVAHLDKCSLALERVVVLQSLDLFDVGFAFVHCGHLFVGRSDEQAIVHLVVRLHTGETLPLEPVALPIAFQGSILHVYYIGQQMQMLVTTQHRVDSYSLNLPQLINFL